MKAHVSMLALPIMLTGCASLTPRQVAEPGDITLEEGVAAFDRSVTYLQNSESRKVGLALDEVTVVFNIAASANAKNAGKVALANVPIATTGTLGLDASTDLTNDGSRGNTITMKFKNLATADLTKGILAQDPAARRRIAAAIDPALVVRNIRRPPPTPSQER